MVAGVVDALLAVLDGLLGLVAVLHRSVAREAPQADQVAAIHRIAVGPGEHGVRVGGYEDGLLELRQVADRPWSHHERESREHRDARLPRALFDGQGQQQQRHEQHRLAPRQRAESHRDTEPRPVGDRARAHETQRQPQRRGHERRIQALGQQRAIGHPQERVDRGDPRGDQADTLAAGLTPGEARESDRRRTDEADRQLLCRVGLEAELPKPGEHQREQRRMLGARVRLHAQEPELGVRDLHPADPVGDRPRPLVIRHCVAEQGDLAREQRDVEKPDDEPGKHGQRKPRTESAREAHGAKGRLARLWTGSSQ